MAYLAARKTTWDNMSAQAKTAIKVASNTLQLGDPAVWVNPQGQQHYLWEDGRIGDGQSWVDAAPPGLFEVFPWGPPEGWAPYSEPMGAQGATLHDEG